MSSNPQDPNGKSAPGRLFLVPAPLDFGCDAQTAITEVLPTGTLNVAARLEHWVCENAKSLRAILKRVDAEVPLTLPLQQLHITELPRLVHKKGTLERDGLFILLGYFVCALGVAYFMLLGDATEQLLKTLAHWFTA